MAKHRHSKLKLAKRQFFQLHVLLNDADPQVWRRIVVPSDFSLQALHSVIQMSMGWQMSHLYDFNIGKDRYSEPDEFDDHPTRPVETPLSVALEGQKKFTYNYDFGDSWTHTVKIEKTFEGAKMKTPICIDGENACPPEDCGGTPGFENLKKVIANPKDEEHENLMDWLGGFYNPNTFDPNRINRDLLWATNWNSEPNDQGLFHPFKFE